MEALGFIAFLAALIAVCWLYVMVKTKAKRSLFFRDLYERQRAVIDHNLVLITTAPMAATQSSLAQYIPDDRSARAAFLGGAMRVRLENPNRIIYEHTPKITTGGSGDRFTASITFKQLDSEQLRAVVSIDRWREKDGVTRRAGVTAMENFMSNVVTAFRAVDPAVQVSR